MEEIESPQARPFSLNSGILAEVCLAICALGLSAIGFFDPRQPLEAMSGWPFLQVGLIWGLVTSIPLLLYLLVFHFSGSRWINDLRKFCFETLRPMFAGSSLLGLALLSISAGIGEELLFRWSLQGGLSHVLEDRIGLLLANLLALLVASLLFGLCHAVTRAYFLITFLGGIFFGASMIYFENWLVPALSHAIYDFAALTYIVKVLKDPASTADAGES